MSYFHEKHITQCVLGRYDDPEWLLLVFGVFMYIYYVGPAYFYARATLLPCYVSDVSAKIVRWTMLVAWLLNWGLQWVVESPSPCESAHPFAYADPLYSTQITFHYASFFLVNMYVFNRRWKSITLWDTLLGPLFIFPIAIFSNNATVWQAMHGAAWGTAWGVLPVLVYHTFFSAERRLHILSS